MAKEEKDPAKVEGPNPGMDEEKVPSGEVKDWEKANSEDGATAAKDAPKTVEKSMKDLGGDGAAPQQIKVGGYIYNRVDAEPAPEFIKIEGQLYKLTGSQKKEAAYYKPVQKAPPETKYQFLISLGPKQYVFFFDGDRRFLGWAPSMALDLEIPADAEVAETNYQLALVPGHWT